MDWTKTHIVFAYNARADALTKEAVTRPKVNARILFFFQLPDEEKIFWSGT